MSPANLDRQRHYYEHFREQLNGIDANRLTAEDQADWNILQDQVSLALLDLNELHSPLNTHSLCGDARNALFSPYVLEYAPLAARLRNIVARLQKVPLFLDQARSNLTSAPGIWTSGNGRERGQHRPGGQDHPGRRAARLRDAYNLAALSALDAMRSSRTTSRTASPAATITPGA